LNRSTISILRDVQQSVDPTGVGLSAAWGASHMQPCPPWVSGRYSNSYPDQNTSLPGYGRSWLGVKCAEWDFSALSTSTLLAGVAALQIKRLGMAGVLSPVLCELYPSLTMLDVSQNNLVGTLPPCIGAQPTTTVAGRMKFSFFDNMARLDTRAPRRPRQQRLSCARCADASRDDAPHRYVAPCRRRTRALTGSPRRSTRF
jgi:hypothetical protein